MKIQLTIITVTVVVLILIIFGLFIFINRKSDINKKSEDILNMQENVAATSTTIPTQSGCQKVKLGTWIAWWEEEKAIISLEKYSNQIASISPVWYFLDENGVLSKSNYKKKAEIKSIAGANNIQITPTINNAATTGFDPKRVTLLLNSPELSENFISELIAKAKNEGYNGWDIDWEQIEKEDRDNFSEFAKQLATELHKNDLILSIALHAQTGKPSDWEKVHGQDWQELGKYADFIIIMAYDFYGPHSEPGPNTPMDKLKSVIKYAKENIPLEKIVIGLPTYGYKWSDDDVYSLQYDEIIQEIGENISNVEYDNESASNSYVYDNGDTIWFEGTESIKVKTEYAQSQGICNFYFWKLGGENETIWSIN